MLMNSDIWNFHIHQMSGKLARQLSVKGCVKIQKQCKLKEIFLDLIYCTFFSV